MTLNGSDVTIFENLSIGVNDEIVTLTELNPAGVSALKARLRALVIDGDVSEISGNVNGSVNGGTLDANLVITIRSSVVGTQSVELPNL